MPASRKDNDYARENNYLDAKKDFQEHLENLIPDDKYRLVNLKRYNPKNGFIVEFRHHSGTREPEKVYLWIRTLLTIFESSKKWQVSATEHGYFYELYKQIQEIDPYAARWMSSRQTKHSEDYEDNTYGFIDDLKGISNSIFFKDNSFPPKEIKFTLKEMILLITYGKGTATKEDWARKITELKSGEEPNLATIDNYARQLLNNDLISYISQGRYRGRFKLTDDGKKEAIKLKGK